MGQGGIRVFWGKCLRRLATTVGHECWSSHPWSRVDLYLPRVSGLLSCNLSGWCPWVLNGLLRTSPAGLRVIYYTRGWICSLEYHLGLSKKYRLQVASLAAADIFYRRNLLVVISSPIRAAWFEFSPCQGQRFSGRNPGKQFGEVGSLQGQGWGWEGEVILVFVKRCFLSSHRVLRLVSLGMFDSEISGARYHGGNGGFDDSPFPGPLKWRWIFMDLEQLLAIEGRNFCLITMVPFRHSPCWGQIKDGIKAFKYPVGYIAVDTEHPYQMPLVQGKKGHIIIIIIFLVEKWHWHPTELCPLHFQYLPCTQGYFLFLLHFLPAAWRK